MSETIASEVSEPGINRRRFLKQLTAACIGGVAGIGLENVARHVSDETEEVTHHPVGNAGLAKDISQHCPDGADEEQCQRNYMLSRNSVIGMLVEAPLVEETAFRAIPSYFVQSRGEGLKMNRNEIIVGSLSSLVFAGLHNLTPSGFDTKTIPSPQVTACAAFWYMQRKLGFASNLAAHSALNGTLLYRAFRNK